MSNKNIAEIEKKIDEVFEQYKDIKKPALSDEVLTLCANELDLNLINVKQQLPKIFDIYTQTLIKLLLRDGKVRVKNFGVFYLNKIGKKKYKDYHYVASGPRKYSIFKEDNYVPPTIGVRFKPSLTLKYNIGTLFKDDNDVGESLQTLASPVDDIGSRWRIDKEQNWYIKISKALNRKYESGESLKWIVNQRCANTMKSRKKYYSVKKHRKRLKYGVAKRIIKHVKRKGIEQFKIDD